MKFFVNFYTKKDYEFDPIKNSENLIAEWNIAKQEIKNFRSCTPENAWV